MLLHVENLGKIKNADIEVLPLTLFIGDNNSGKSYLLSLIWALSSLDKFPQLFSNSDIIKNEPKYVDFTKYVDTIIASSFTEKSMYRISLIEIFDIFNKLLDKEKNDFISNIFNCNMEIGKLSFSISKEENINFRLSISDCEVDKSISRPGSSNEVLIKVFYSQKRGVKYNAPKDTLKSDNSKYNIFAIMFRYLISKFIVINKNSPTAVYLPAARTGFMLSRNVINSMSRKNTFDFNYENNLTIKSVEPFTKPIIDFLDFIESGLNVTDINQKYNELTQLIEDDMVHGKLEYDDARNIKYIPNGNGKSLPLRATSAVVTELTPLLLLLKQRSNQIPISTICYEEPEMCLHSQLQSYMAKLLIRLTNSDLKIIVTTHSDIILQHINNMGILKSKLSESNDYHSLMEEYQLIDDDLLDFEKIAVYQLKDCGDHSEVLRLNPTSRGFDANTFTASLTKLFNQSYRINSLDKDDDCCD